MTREEKQLDLDAAKRQIAAAQIEAWLPLEVVRVLELAPLMVAEIEQLRGEAVIEAHNKTCDRRTDD
ncbi:hypothetical protein U6G28_02545 [Actinomycetaceae bacterium MB13-C1-2]|nr:hypothetical protein U6G28_02545 [Actinomycetaceae bacterium MB13-C1-2]